MRFRREARRTLWKQRRVRATLRIDAVDRAGNLRRIERSVTLAR